VEFDACLILSRMICELFQLYSGLILSRIIVECHKRNNVTWVRNELKTFWSCCHKNDDFSHSAILLQMRINFSVFRLLPVPGP